MNPKVNYVGKKPGKRGGTVKIPRSLTRYDKQWSGVPAGGEWFNDAEMARSYLTTKYGVGKGFVLVWGLPVYGYWYGAYLDYAGLKVLF